VAVGGERLYTEQAGPASREVITGNFLGEIFTISENGRFVVGGASWVENGAFFPWWQIWSRLSTTLLREGDITALDPAAHTSPAGGTGWFYFALADLTPGTTVLTPLPLVTGGGNVYQVGGWTPVGTPGNQVYTDAGFSYPFGVSPLAATGSVYGNPGDARSVYANNTGFTSGRFYFDVTLESSFIAARPFIVSVASRAVLDRLKRLGRNLFTRPAIVDPPSALPDPTTYTVGQPQSRWHTRAPRSRWDVGDPHSKWSAGKPRGEA
jgi:hypothetical protein